MRTLMPLLIGVAAVVAGLAAATVRDAALGEPAGSHRGFVAGVWAGVVLTGTVLLAIGWWASGLAVRDVAPSAFASVAYVGGAIELFLGGLLAARVVRPGPRGRGALAPRPRW
ncbi:MAG: hypothetical protein ACXVQJ_06875 [Actinomycetota bacterium]